MEDSESQEIDRLNEESNMATQRATACVKVKSKVKVKPSPIQPMVKVKAPDGGYGWVIVLASFWVQFLLVLPHVVYGVLYPNLLEAFGRSNADTAWPGSICAGCNLIFGKQPAQPELNQHHMWQNLN